MSKVKWDYTYKKPKSWSRREWKMFVRGLDYSHEIVRQIWVQNFDEHNGLQNQLSHEALVVQFVLQELHNELAQKFGKRALRRV